MVRLRNPIALILNLSYLMSLVRNNQKNSFNFNGATDVYSDFSGLPPQLSLVYDFVNDPE